MFSLKETRVHYKLFNQYGQLASYPVPANLKGARAKAEHDRLDKIIKEHEAHMPNEEIFKKLIDVIYKKAEIKPDQRVFSRVEFPDHIKYTIFKRDNVWKPLAEGKLLDASKFDEFKQKLEAWRDTMKKDKESAEIQQEAINDGNAMLAMFIKHSEFKNICCFEGCDNNYGQFGNNPAPFRFPPHARCCDECNECVVSRRLAVNAGINTAQGAYRKMFQGFSQKCERVEHLEEYTKYAEKKMREMNDERDEINKKIREANKYIKEAEKYKALYEKEQREHKKLLKKQNKMLEDAMRKERAETKKQICDMERKIADLRKKLKNSRR